MPQTGNNQAVLNKGTHKLWYIYITEEYAAIKSNELLTHTAKCMNLKAMMLNGNNQQKATYGMFPSTYNSRKGKVICSDRKHSMSLLGVGRGEVGRRDHKGA